MSIRPAVEDLAQAGPLPSEETATVERLDEIERLLKQEITAPVSDEEAQVLVGLFGPDNCFGLAWSLLHLIETAPGTLTADYSGHAGNEWVELLQARRQSADERLG